MDGSESLIALLTYVCRQLRRHGVAFGQPASKNLAGTAAAMLTHWGRDEIDAISQTTLPNAFSWMKMYRFRLIFHRTLFPGIQLSIFHHWVRWWLGAVQATSHYLDQWWLVYWRIYASLGLNELTRWSRFEIATTVLDYKLQFTIFCDYIVSQFTGMFVRVLLIIVAHIGSDNGVASNRRHPTIWTDDNPLYWQAYSISQ